MGSEDGTCRGPLAFMRPLCCNKESPFPSWEADSFRALRTWDLQQAFAGSSPDGPPAPTGPPLPGPSSALTPSQPASKQSGAQNWGGRNEELSSPHCSSSQQTRLTHHLAFTCAECPQHLQLPVTLGTSRGGTRKTPAWGSASGGGLPQSCGRPWGLSSWQMSPRHWAHTWA